MIAVADTSPICYLILIGEIDLLPELFTQVLVPHAIIAELSDRDAPEAVRAWASNLPPWVSVRESPAAAAVQLQKLQAGEQAAIDLAESVRAGVVLLDEKSARRVAGDRGLRFAGTLGILAEAAARGLVDLATAVTRRTCTNFRYSPALLKAAFDRLRPR